MLSGDESHEERDFRQMQISSQGRSSEMEEERVEVERSENEVDDKWNAS